MTGRVLDSDGRPIAGTLVEVWQANAAGRYQHATDNHPAPLDPNFSGVGRCVTDSEGRYRFVTIKPGAYPWRNHPNAWRPAHIHFSLFGRAFTQRLVTQMYFPGDPLFEYDPIFNSIPDPKARQRLISRFDLNLTEPDWALGYEWDIVLRGSAGDRLRGAAGSGLALTPSQTVGPYLAIGLPWPDGPTVVPEGTPGAITITGRLLDGEGAPIPDGADRDVAGRPGRPVRASGRPARRASGTAPRSAASAAARPPRTAATASSPSGPARCPARTAAGRPRTWTCRCSPAACWTGW